MEEPEDPNDLGVAIKRLRGPRTQASLAEAAGLKPSSWSDYERGKGKPRPPQKRRIAEALGCTVRELELEELSVAGERLAAEEQQDGVREAVDTSDSLIENTDKELEEIDQTLDTLLARKKRLLVFRRMLAALPPGTPVPSGL